MPAHLQETPVKSSIFANEDGLNGGLYIIVNAVRAGAFKESEGTVMRVEHHLLRLARIGSDKEHPAMTEPDMCYHQWGGHTSDDHNLVAPNRTGKPHQRQFSVVLNREPDQRRSGPPSESDFRCLFNGLY